MVDEQTGRLIEWNVISSKYHKNIFTDTKCINITEDDTVVFAQDILADENWRSPWIKPVDKDNPPEGYRLVRKDEMKTTVKPNDYMWWYSTNSIWIHSSEAISYPRENWNAGSLYAIPVNIKLKSKVKELSVKEVSDLLGYEVKIVKEK
jgi:hypothetical protein